jgi:membrane protease YdiL (CAAX protease family)
MFQRTLKDITRSTTVPEEELASPTFATVFKVVWQQLRTFRFERAAQIVGSAFVLLMLWGYHGNLELLKLVLPAWSAPGVDIASRPAILPFVPWDRELISFWGGALLLVLVPIAIIKFGFKQSLRDYGLGLPPPGRWKLAGLSFILLMAVSAPAFVLGATDPAMRATYPFYQPFDSVGQFLLYQLTYLPFFIAIEFIFRGYLLFGLSGVRDDEVTKDIGVQGAFFFGRYALLIQMLSYTAWHLGKPLPELWGTLIWGLVAGAAAYTVRSIWPVVAAHWLLNVLLDGLILLT